MIKLIIFDYDGVLVDSFSNVYEVYKIICKELGVSCPKTIEAFRTIYGYNHKVCYKNLGIPPEAADEGSKIYQREIVKRKPSLFAGIKDVLGELKKKYTLAVVSATYQEEVEQKLKTHQINDFFSSVIGVHNSKSPSKAQGITDTMHKFGVTPEETIMIGDRDVDYDQAKQAQVNKIILVDYGWGYSKEKIPQKVLVKQPSDLLVAVGEILE